MKEIAFNYGWGCVIPEEMQKSKIPWTEICQIKDPKALDLLDKMLELDFSKRITPQEALNHSFFDSVRED